jgi:hypothetical protein
MNIRRIIQRSIRSKGGGVKAAVTEDEKAEALEAAREDGDRVPVTEHGSPPIDDDITGPVNAAVPPGDDES